MSAAICPEHVITHRVIPRPRKVYINLQFVPKRIKVAFLKAKLRKILNQELKENKKPNPFFTGNNE